MCGTAATKARLGQPRPSDLLGGLSLPAVLRLRLDSLPFRQSRHSRNTFAKDLRSRRRRPVRRASFRRMAARGLWLRRRRRRRSQASLCTTSAGPSLSSRAASSTLKVRRRRASLATFTDLGLFAGFLMKKVEAGPDGKVSVFKGTVVLRAPALSSIDRRRLRLAQTGSGRSGLSS